MNQPEKFPPPFRLGPWLVRPDLNRIEGGDGSVQVEPRVMKVLLCLAEKPDLVLTRLELLDLVWGDTVVGEEILTRAVSELRRVFGDSARQPRYIETIRNHGYRLITEVEPVAEEILVEEPVAEEALADAPVEMPAAELPPAQPSSPAKPLRSFSWRPVAAVALVVLVALAAVRFWPRIDDSPPPSQSLASAVPLTSYQGREWHPALSPDGTRVGFVRRLPESDHSDLFIKQRDSEAALQLTDGPGWAAWPAWSPDGQSLAFVCGEAGQSVLCSVSSLGGPVRRLQVVDSYVDGLDWSPDGKHLVYSALAEDSGEHRLFQLSLEDMTGSILPAAEDDHAGDFQPSYSPDGSQLAWLSVAQDGTGHLFVGPVEGGRSRRVSEGLAAVQGLTWTADGQSLVYAASLGGAFSLYQVKLGAAAGPVQAPQWLPTSGDFAWNPTIARQTGDLAYEQVRVDQDLWRVRVLSRNPWQLETTPFIQSTRWEYEARYNPDGRQVALVSARTGTPEIWLADAEGKELQQLTRLQLPGLANLRWSPDGQQLAFNAVQEGRQVIMLMGSNGGVPRQLTPDDRQEILSGWSTDGLSILFGSEEKGGWEIFRRYLEGGLIQPVTRGGGITAQESPDGKSLYFTRPGWAGLWRMDLTLEADETELIIPELIIPELAGQDRGNWLVHEEGIYWIIRSGPSAILAEYDPARGASSFITDLPGFSGTGLGISPAGDAVIFAQTGEMAGDLMIFQGWNNNSSH